MQNFGKRKIGVQLIWLPKKLLQVVIIILLRAIATIVAAENVFEPRVHVFGLKHCLHFVTLISNFGLSSTVNLQSFLRLDLLDREAQFSIVNPSCWRQNFKFFKEKEGS